jgi:tetratricopeptide (TPR) repeat protein
MTMKHSTAALACMCASLFAVVPPRSVMAEPDAGQRCAAADSGPEAWIAACSEIIASHAVDGEALAAAYAQRGYAYTLLRKLPEAEKDLDQAVKINPKSAVAFVDRANFWNVSGKRERALADSERALTPARGVLGLLHEGPRQPNISCTYVLQGIAGLLPISSTA